MTVSPCIKLASGQDLACKRISTNKHFQIAILFVDTITDANFEIGYSGKLRPIKIYTGNIFQSEILPTKAFQAPPNSNAISGQYRKTEDKFGYAEYEHEVTLLTSAFSEEEKRQIHALNNNIWKIGLFNRDRTGELYGGHYGLTSTAYSFENSSTIISFRSRKKELSLPLLFDGLNLDSIDQDMFKIFDQTFDITFE